MSVSARRNGAGIRRPGTISWSRSAIPASACRRRCGPARSSRSSPLGRRARLPVSGCRGCMRWRGTRRRRAHRQHVGRAPWSGSTCAGGDGAEAAAVPVAAIARGGRREAIVLLVDDDEAVRSTTAMILETMGYVVLQAARRRRLDLLTTEPAIGILLTDVAMPGMNGAELARARAWCGRDCRSCSFPATPILTRWPAMPSCSGSCTSRSAPANCGADRDGVGGGRADRRVSLRGRSRSAPSPR